MLRRPARPAPDDGRVEPREHDDPTTRTALPAYVTAALGPPAAWLAWVSWSDGKASDASHLAWFVTVALTTLAAGALVGPGRLHRAVAAVLAVASTLTTLWLWWSSSADNGLFVIGFALWLVPVLVGAPLLVGLGARVRWRPGVRR